MGAIKLLCCYIFLISLFASCSKPGENNMQVVSISVLIDDEGLDISKNKYSLTKENNEGLIFKYFNENSTWIIFRRGVGDFFLIGKGDTLQLFEETSRNYEIDNNKYLVYRLIENNGQIDGGFVHYVSLDYGLLISRSLTWNQFLEIKTNSETAELLKSIVYNDRDFLQVVETNDEIKTPTPPPPK